MATTKYVYEIVDYNDSTGRLLLSREGAWMVVDPVPEQPIVMTLCDTEVEARTVFEAH